MRTVAERLGLGVATVDKGILCLGTYDPLAVCQGTRVGKNWSERESGFLRGRRASRIAASRPSHGRFAAKLRRAKKKAAEFSDFPSTSAALSRGDRV